MKALAELTQLTRLTIGIGNSDLAHSLLSRITDFTALGRCEILLCIAVLVILAVSNYVVRSLSSESQQGAVTSMLDQLCDAVCHLDERMDIMRPLAELASLLH